MKWFSHIRGKMRETLVSASGDLSHYERVINFGRIRGYAGNIYGDASGIEGPVSCIRGNVTGLRGDVSGLIGFVGNIHGDVSDLGGFVCGLLGDVSRIKGHLGSPLITKYLGGNKVDCWSDPAIGWIDGLEGDLTGIHGNLTHIHGKVQKDLTGDVSLIWGDISGLTGQINSNYWRGNERGKVGKPQVYGDATGLSMNLDRFRGDLSLMPRKHQDEPDRS